MVSLDYEIRIISDLANEQDQLIRFSSQATQKSIRLHLSIFSDGIKQLQGEGYRKDGIQEHVALNNGDLLTIGIEIDLHSKSQRKPV